MELSYYKKMEPFWGVWYIDKELGAGSFGRVFKIRREDFGETYYSALKIISMPNDKDEIENLKTEGLDDKSISDYYDSFASEIGREFSLMAKIKGHSNIVSYEDHLAIRHTDGIGYDILIRMELLTPLTSYIREQKMTEETIVRLGINICNALEICEENNIIHRDIKPENVFVSRYGLFKLGDFGVSRIASQSTQGMSVKGTISYMAPEVYKGQQYNNTVDLYSLGIMLYRLSNNNRGPFLPPAPAPLKYADRENAENLRMSGAELPDAVNASPELMRIIKKASAYNYKDRYRTAAEMRADLEALLGGAVHYENIHREEATISGVKERPSKAELEKLAAMIPFPKEDGVRVTPTPPGFDASKYVSTKLTEDDLKVLEIFDVDGADENATISVAANKLPDTKEAVKETEKAELPVDEDATISAFSNKIPVHEQEADKPAEKVAEPVKKTEDQTIKAVADEDATVSAAPKKQEAVKTFDPDATVSAVQKKDAIKESDSEATVSAVEINKNNTAKEQIPRGNNGENVLEFTSKSSYSLDKIDDSGLDKFREKPFWKRPFVLKLAILLAFAIVIVIASISASVKSNQTQTVQQAKALPAANWKTPYFEVRNYVLSVPEATWDASINDLSVVLTNAGYKIKNENHGVGRKFYVLSNEGWVAFYFDNDKMGWIEYVVTSGTDEVKESVINIYPQLKLDDNAYVSVKTYTGDVVKYRAGTERTGYFYQEIYNPSLK